MQILTVREIVPNPVEIPRPLRPEPVGVEAASLKFEPPTALVCWSIPLLPLPPSSKSVTFRPAMTCRRRPFNALRTSTKSSLKRSRNFPHRQAA